MPRAPRIVAAGGTYHVYARGNRRSPIFLDDRDRERFVGLLAKEVARRRWGCRSYCLMTNHFHLVIELRAPNLSIGMQMLMGVYARWFNWRRELDGHLFERRFSSLAVETTEYFVELARYLALNPVWAGLCDRPEDWRWGSYRASVGLGRREPFLDDEPLVACFGRTARLARRGLAAFVAEGLGAERDVAWPSGHVLVPGTGTRPGGTAARVSAAAAGASRVGAAAATAGGGRRRTGG